MLFRSVGTNGPGGLRRNLLRLRFKNASNTSVVFHGGKLLALRVRAARRETSTPRHSGPWHAGSAPDRPRAILQRDPQRQPMRCATQYLGGLIAKLEQKRARRLAHCAQCPSIAISNLIENALRHGAARVGVVLSVVHGRYRIEVMDDGPGVPATMQPGRGLTIIRAVAEAIGAEFTRFDPPPSANRIVGAGAHTHVCASTLP